MKIFCHVNEFGYLGWEALPAAILLSERVSIWAPSFKQLQDANANNKGCIIEPHHVLDLIKLGKIQVAAREGWFYPDERQANHRWIGSAWHPKYDSELRLMAQSYGQEKVDPNDHGVRIMPEERGTDWAFGLDEEDPHYKRAQRRYEDERLPPGILERANRRDKKDKAVRWVLSGAKNHEDAVDELGVFASIEPSEHPEAVADIMDRKPPRSVPGIDYDLEKLQELIEVATSIQTLKSGDDLVKRASDPNYGHLASEIAGLLQSRYPIIDEWSREVSRAAEKGTEKRRRSLLQEIGTGLGQEVIATSLWALLSFNLSLGIAPFIAVMFPFSKRFLQAKSVIPAEYEGPLLPFMLMSGTLKPTKKEIEELLRRLAQLM